MVSNQASLSVISQATSFITFASNKTTPISLARGIELRAALQLYESLGVTLKETVKMLGLVQGRFLTLLTLVIPKLPVISTTNQTR